LGDKAFATFDGNSAVNRYLSALTIVKDAPTGSFGDDTAARLNGKIDAARVAAAATSISANGFGGPDQDTQLRMNPEAGDPLDRLQQTLRDAAAAQG
jgi:hypothetical protein